MADDIRCAKELYDEDNNLKYVSTVEDARAVMRHCSPGRTDFKIRAFKEGIFVYGLCGLGALGLLAPLTGIKHFTISTPVILILIPVFPFAVSFAVESVRIHKARKKNDAIMSGAYFEGKSDRQIINEANRDFVRFLNNLKVIEANIASWERAEGKTRAQKRTGFRFPFGRPRSK